MAVMTTGVTAVPGAHAFAMVTGTPGLQPAARLRVEHGLLTGIQSGMQVQRGLQALFKGGIALGLAGLELCHTGRQVLYGRIADRGVCVHFQAGLHGLFKALPSRLLTRLQLQRLRQ